MPLLDEGDVLRRLVRVVRPRSTVLVCGFPSAGFLDDLAAVPSCRVSVVTSGELVKEARSWGAFEFIEGDLENADWTEALSGHAFDYVLLPYTLDAVLDPTMLLACCARVLTNEGSLWASLHNAASNRRAALLLSGSSGCQVKGSLRLAGARLAPRDLQPLFVTSGLGIIRADYMAERPCSIEDGGFDWYFEMGVTELKAPELNPWGRVEHMLVEARKSAVITPENVVSIQPPAWDMSALPCTIFYAGEGEQFSPDRRLCLFVYPERRFVAVVNVAELNATRLRYDPIEGHSCMVEDLCVRANYEEVAPRATNGMPFERGYLFNTGDPQIEIVLPQGTHTVQISAMVTPLFGRTEKLLMGAVDARVKSLAQEQQLRARDAVRAAHEQKCLQEKLSTLTDEKKVLRKRVTSLERNVSTLERKVKVGKEHERSIKWTARHLGGLVLRRLHLKR